MVEEKEWWVGRKVDCSLKPCGNLCSNSWTLGENDKPIFSHRSSDGKDHYKVPCPLCGSLADI